MNRLLLTLASVMTMALAGAAHAQTGLDGRWAVTFATEGSDGREAELVLKGGTGHWTTRARANKDKKDPCVGRELPVTLSAPSASTIGLRIDASQALAACKDRKASLRQVDDKTLEGEFDNGRPLRLVRQ